MLKAVTYFASRIFCIATLTERVSRDPCVYETATTAAGQKQRTLGGIKPVINTPRRLIFFHNGAITSLTIRASILLFYSN